MDSHFLDCIIDLKIQSSCLDVTEIKFKWNNIAKHSNNQKQSLK